MESLLEKVHIRRSMPGDAGYVAYMHGKYYHENHGLYEKFEYYFIKHLADFVRDPAGGALWVAEIGGVIIGSVAIVRAAGGAAQLRWFIVEKAYQNIGIGNRLISTALAFCRKNAYKSVFLWTFQGLDAARWLYDKAGFALTEEKQNNEWSDAEIIEQKMELILA